MTSPLSPRRDNAQWLRLIGAALLLCSGSAVLAQSATVDPDLIRVLISPAQETTLVAPMNGRLQAVNVQLGSAFKQGDALMVFDCAEYQAKARIARAELRSARENHNAKTRLRDLNAAGDVEVNLAAADVEKNSGQVELARVQTDYCQVLAPFDGRVARLHAKQFQGLNAGAPLLDIIANGPLKVRLHAPSRLLSRLQVGSPMRIHVDETAQTYPATVTALSARIDAAAQAIEIEGQLDGDYPELLAGMSGAVHFDTHHE